LTLRENIEEIFEEMERISSSRDKVTGKPRLIAVTKTVPIDIVKGSLEFGITDIGENRVQEFEKKYAALGEAVNHHFIGNLQTNKVKNLIGKACMIHSLDRLSLLKEIEKRSEQAATVTRTLIQLNISKEESKTGIYLEDLAAFLEEVERTRWVRVDGFMTMAPFTSDEKIIRDVFRKTYETFVFYKDRSFKNIEMKHLSMGMTQDYKIALEEGANMIRVGSGIYK
jgi:pyridoxal phosphate enzyme (YggS family)